MKLDVVVPTYNRSCLLQKALNSLLSAPVPDQLKICIFVVDNNSTDSTFSLVDQMSKDASLPITYIRETKQGLSHARNAGIAAGSGDLIGFIDDDEEIGSDWYEVIAREFADPTTEFVGGPCLPNWVTPVPDWLPPGYHSAIGAIPPKPRSHFDSNFSGNLMGGNAVIRRQVFEKVGTYSTRLGRSATGLLSEEDAEFLRRLKAHNISGLYVPELVIHHYIAPERLTRSYHRRWAFWRAASQGVLDRELREPVTYLFGVPRHRFGRAVKSLFAIPNSKSKGHAFANELALWDLAGFIHGKFFLRVERMYGADAAQSSVAEPVHPEADPRLGSAALAAPHQLQ